MLGFGTGGAVRTVIGIIMAVLVAIVIIGGIKRIASVTEKLVPLMAIIYIIASLVILTGCKRQDVLAIDHHDEARFFTF